MKPIASAALFCAAAALLCAQSAPLPADIDPQTFSRLPPIPRAQFDANGQRIYDALMGRDATAPPRLGPAAITLHSIVVAEPWDALNQAVRKSPITPRYVELCTLVAAREFDSEYEWSAHEPAAQRAGVPQDVIDAVRGNGDTAGLLEKDALVITFGRELFRRHKIDSALYAKVVGQFGKQGMVDITVTLGDYAMTAFLLSAVDQHLPPGRTANLPAK
jgi:4-carboxymuconolactone decarboxylase